jgi:catechol 2,3-dioxygenase
MTAPIKVTRLAHLEINVTDLDRSSEFYNDRWGLDLAEEHDGRRYFRSDTPDFHTLVMGTGIPDLDHVSFVVADSEELKRAEDVLERAGADVVLPVSSGVEPGIGSLLRFRDPNGLLVELVADVEERHESYGVRDVKPRGLDHVVLRVPDFDVTKQFYQQVLGFRLSDETDGVMAFMRCNANHHSLAFVNADTASLHHAAFTVDDWSTLATGVKSLGDAGICRIWGPGRHGPGDNLFSYFLDPDGHILEYTCEVQQIPDDAAWEPRIWARGRKEKWGTPMPPEMR